MTFWSSPKVEVDPVLHKVDNLDIMAGNLPHRKVVRPTGDEKEEGSMAGNPVNLPSLAQIEIGVTKLAAIAGAIEGSTDLGGLPVWLRVTLLSVSGAIITVNHWLNLSSTPTP